MNVCKKKKKLQEWMQMMHVLGFKVEKRNKKRVYRYRQRVDEKWRR